VSKWEMVKLSEAFDLQMGKTPSRSNMAYWNNGANKWVSIADIGLAEKYIHKTKETISDLAVAESGIKKVPMNTVIMSFKLSLGKTCIVQEDMYTNEAIMAFVDKGKFGINKNYLYHLFRGKDWSVGTNKAVMGATLNKATLSNVEIPLPPLEIQTQIAKTLDIVTELIAMRKQQLVELDNLIKSTFYNMFGDLAANEKGWKICGFVDVATIDTKMTKDFNKYAEYPHIGIDCIEKNTGNIVGYELIKDSKLISGKYLFSEQHIIYSKIRPNLNKVALPTFSGLCSADAYPILTKANISNKFYLAYILRSDFFLNYILDFSGRTNIPKVNKQQLEGFQLPTPPIVLQDKFASIVTKIEEQKTLVKKSIDETQYLFDSLMCQYFE
jgi:type I restriction enzyme S subunit